MAKPDMSSNICKTETAASSLTAASLYKQPLVTCALSTCQESLSGRCHLQQSLQGAQRTGPQSRTKISHQYALRAGKTVQAVYPASNLQPQHRLLHMCRGCAPVKPNIPDFCIHICSKAVLHGHSGHVGTQGR